jgi:hypothetical protein
MGRGLGWQVQRGAGLRNGPGRDHRPTLLAPDIVEAILDGRRPAEFDPPRLMKPFPVDWPDQATVLDSARAAARFR